MERFSRFESQNHEPFLRPLEPNSQTWKIVSCQLSLLTVIPYFQYSAGVTCLRWLPLDLDPTGVQILIGYADGVLRLFALESDTDTGAGGKTVYRLTKALAAK